MNCKEALDLAEEAMDKDLPRAVKRRLDLHLSRCESCRRLFEAERAEHVRWFRIFNDPAALRSLPPGFADRLAASVRSTRPGFWFRIPRWLKRAACFALLLSGVAFAATVVVDAISTKEDNSEETVGRAALSAPEANEGTVGEGALAASETGGTRAVASPEVPSDENPPTAADQIPSSDNQLENEKGEEGMNIKQKAATVLAAAMLAAPTSADMGATYMTGNAPLASGEVNLRTVAVEDGSGNLVVLWNGNTSWWTGNQNTAFDGATDAPYNPRSVSSATWVGYELTVPRVVTRIRFCAPGSTDNPSRLRVCQVEGANQPDFSDAVLLLECKHVVPVNWMTGSPYWFEAPARSFTTPQTFRYIRFIQPRGASEPNTFCGNVTEVEFYGMDTESYANYTPTVAKETNLRLYAIHETTGALDILSDKTTPYASGYDYSKSLDEDTSTFYDAPNNTTLGHYVGYALSVPMAVTRIRYYGRPSAEYWPRIFYCRIEGANQADFSDAVTLHNCSDSAPADWYQHPAWIEVVPDKAIGLDTFRYLRFVDPSGTHQCGNVAEVEFYGMDADALASSVLADLQSPTDVTASRDDFPQGGTVLRWKVQPGVSESSILRSFGAGGPWTEVAQVRGTTTWTDTTAPAGAMMYYRLVSQFSYNGESAANTNDAVVSARRWRILERDPSDMSKVRSGVSAVYKSGTGYWTGGSLAGSAALAFDNKWPPDTAGNYPDMSAGSPRTCIGVDLSERAHLALVRFYAGRNGEYVSRINNVVISGSNESDWYSDGKFVTLTAPLQFGGTLGWYDLESTNTEDGYRYLFCHNPSNNGWSNNASELQFYGWLESDLAALATVAQGVSGVVGTCGTTPSVTLSWTPASSYGTFAIERMVGNGEWAEVASGISGATWTDADVVCDGTTYAYRVKTVNGGGFAYSETYSIAPYIVGNGIGLHGVWSSPYSSTNIGESVVSVETNAVIDFANVSVGGSTTGFSVRWTGKLIVPTSAEYLFDAEADDTVALWIDGTPILYRNTKSGTSQSAPDGAVTLAAGEHDIVMTWFQDDGDNLCRLYWSGPFDRCIVPTSQLLPVPSELPEGWAGARTFSNAASVNYPGDVRFNGNGTIDLAYGGADLYLSQNGYNFLWQPMTGDFVCKARVESQNLSVTQGMPQKGGLMVRAALDSGSPFEACMLKWENGTDGVKLRLGSKRCSSRGSQPVDGRDIISNQAAWKYAVTGRAGWIRLRREGNVFTYSYRNDGESVWTPIYQLVDAGGEYGNTVYVGLASCGATTNVPRFDWRFSDVSLRPISGAIFIVR